MNVFICHPFQASKRNLELTKQYCYKAIKEGHNPISPAIYYSQLLDDNDEKERLLGRKFGLNLLDHCDELWICGDEISEGMKSEIKEAYKINKSQHDIRITQVNLND